MLTGCCKPILDTIHTSCRSSEAKNLKLSFICLLLCASKHLYLRKQKRPQILFCYLRHDPLGFIFVCAVAGNLEITLNTLEKKETPYMTPASSDIKLMIPLSNESLSKGNSKRGNSVILSAQRSVEATVLLCHVYVIYGNHHIGILGAKCHFWQ